MLMVKTYEKFGLFNPTVSSTGISVTIGVTANSWVISEFEGDRFDHRLLHVDPQSSSHIIYAMMVLKKKFGEGVIT